MISKAFGLTSIEPTLVFATGASFGAEFDDWRDDVVVFPFFLFI